MRLPQADETLRGGWWWGPSAPFLRDVEVAAHPVSLLGGGEQKVSLAGGAEHLLSWHIQIRRIHTRTQGSPFSHCRPRLKVFVERQRRDPNDLGTMEKAQHRKVATITSAG